MPEKQICIHAHFYQPPRENPWLEEVETEESAAPYHDWNQRISKECYAPNTAARILGKGGKIAEIANNYEKVSFNFGPTLLSWMERHDPETYQKILEADRASIRTRGGHGNAIAQVYNHSIMPLNSRRDKETQIIWGIKDFEFRFGRKPEGIWFAETAVDDESLAIAAAHGIKFTILSPRQARRVRPIKAGAHWSEVNGNPDPRRPYRYRPDEKHEMALFFYDGDVSHAVAFEGALFDGQRLADMLMARFLPAQQGERQLVHAATDGESYGHHHKFGEMALAAALAALGKRADVALTNYGQYLEANPPQWEADIFQNSSWSCMHGVERWRSDCGCSTGGEAGWNQKWRTPLRAALDGLKEKLDAIYEEGLGAVFLDPWEARNDYIEVNLKRSEDRLKGFFTRHQKFPLSEEQEVTALKYLEMQKMAMRMYTSCGWFFTDISGLESMQILKYAARAIDLAQELALKPLDDEFIAALAPSRSNLKQHGTGADLYRRHIVPLRLNPLRMAAHAIITNSLEAPAAAEKQFYCFRVEMQDSMEESYLESRMAVGVMQIQNSFTLESRKLSYCLLHFGMHDFNCFIRPFFEPADYLATRSELAETFRRRSLPELLRAVEKHFGQTYYTVTALFNDQRRRVMERLITPRLDQFAHAYEELFNDSRALMDFHADINVPIPEEFRIAARYVFEKQLGRLFADTAAVSDHETMGKTMAEAARWGLQLSTISLAAQLAVYLEFHIARACGGRQESAALSVEVMEKAARYGISLDPWRIQNLLYPHYQAWRQASHPSHAQLRASEPFGRLLELFNFPAA